VPTSTRALALIEALVHHRVFKRFRDTPLELLWKLSTLCGGSCRRFDYWLSAMNGHQVLIHRRKRPT